MKLPPRPRFPWNRGKSVEMTFEEQMLRTATLALIAFGAVMVYSASSGTSLLSNGGDSSEYLKRYVASAALGLVALSYFARHGLETAKRLTPILLVVAFAGLVLVMVPGFGIEANGSRRWLGAGPLQFQPSEIAKLALVLYAALLISSEPRRVRSLAGVRPLILLAGGDGLPRGGGARPRHGDGDLPHARGAAAGGRRQHAPSADPVRAASRRWRSSPRCSSPTGARG